MNRTGLGWVSGGSVRLGLFCGLLLWSGASHGETVELVLHDPADRTGPVNGCDVPLCTLLLERIEQATERVDFALYGVRKQSAIVEALKAAQARGVVVRGVVDRDGAGKSYYSGTNSLKEDFETVRDDYDFEVKNLREAEDRGRGNYTPPCRAPDGFEGPVQCLGYDLGDRCLISAQAARTRFPFNAGVIMHNKFMIIDQQYVWTGSTNLSDSGTGGYNANLVTLIDHPEVAGWYTYEFEQMWGQGRYHDDKVTRGLKQLDLEGGDRLEVLFSPQDRPISSRVRPLIQKATSNIDVAVFFLTHKGITQDLLEARLRGVNVRIIMDATGASNDYSKHELLRVGGIPVKVEDWGGKMHAKSAMIDDHIVIVGSMNWTGAGEGGNDENTVILYSESKAKQYKVWFEQMWRDLPERWLAGRPDPESLESRTACTDRSDNDFDGKRDKEDEGCGPTPPPLPSFPPVHLVPKAAGHGLVKGVRDEEGHSVYLTETMRSYPAATVSEELGEEWFCSESQARAEGYRRFSED
jgi:phosphatidylserine/phosphatidylglycerophosphate/cardiolipin synthase-like enzyme